MAGTTSSSAFLAEWASKTEPLSPDYAGTYTFGHNAQNPLSTGNGYANALLGVFTTYTELTNRVDRDRRHWQTEGYVQDSWRVKSGLTLDYGVRLTHTGSYFDTRQSTAGFYEPELVGGPGAAPLPADVHDGCARERRPARPTTSAHTIRPTRAVLLPSAYIGNLVPGSGSQINGMIADGYPGMRPGEYFKLHPVRRGAARRVCLGHQRERQAGAARVHGHVLRDTHTRGVGRVRRHGAGGVQPPGAVGDVRGHRELRHLRQDVRRDADQLRSTPAAKRARSRSPTT